MSIGIKNILTSRLAKNIYFWAFAITFIYVLNINADDYDRSVYNTYKAITTSLLILMTYANNLVLIPQLLAKKRKLIYATGVIMLLLFSASVFVVVVKNMLASYPKIEVHEISIITSPVSQNWSFAAFLQEVPTYAFGLGLWVLSFTMAWYMIDHTKQEKLASEAVKKQLETELSLLRNQVSPHFFFNTLNNIYGLSIQKSDKAPQAILQLSSVMRYLLYETDIKKVSFEKEKEVMQSYIDMELLRLPEDYDFRFEMSADKEYSIPPLLWLPVLENVFKHGTRFIADNYYIYYSFTIVNNQINIVAENNYKETPDKNGGLGITNLQKRLNILFPEKHEINIQRKDKRYSIEVKINLS